MAGKKEAIEPREWPLIGMTTREAAKAMRINERTLCLLIRDKGLPAKKCGVSWRLDPEAIRKWLGDGNMADDCVDNNNKE